MYGWFGCTTFFHLFATFRLVIAAVGMAGLVSYVQGQAPGNLMGTTAVLEKYQAQIVAQNPNLPGQVQVARMEFDKYEVRLTDEQVRYVLKFTDACTDANVRDVLSDPDKRREAAWIFFLDLWSREGPVAANKLLEKQVRKRDPVPLK